MAIALIGVAGILGALMPGLHRLGGRLVDVVRDAFFSPPARAEDSVLLVGMSAAEARDPGAWVSLLQTLARAEARAVVCETTWDQPGWEQSVVTQRLEEVLTECAARTNGPLPVVLGLHSSPAVPDKARVYSLAPLPIPLARVISNHAGWVRLGVSDPDELGNARRPFSVEAVGPYRFPPLGAVVASMLEGRNWGKGERRLCWYPELLTMPRAEWGGGALGEPGLRMGGREALSLVRNRVVFVTASGDGASATADFSHAELHATLFLNLVRGEGAAPYPPALAVLLALGSAILAGWWFPRWSPTRAAWTGAAWLAGAFVAGLVLVTSRGLDFPWLSVWGTQAVAAAGVAWLPVKSVFLSYRRSDGRHVAIGIARGLRALGVEVFLEVERHDSGQLGGFLAAAMQRQGNLAVILTPDVIHRWNPARDWIQFELRLARELGRNRIPVFVDDFEPDEVEVRRGLGLGSPAPTEPPSQPWGTGQ